LIWKIKNHAYGQRKEKEKKARDAPIQKNTALLVLEFVKRASLTGAYRLCQPLGHFQSSAVYEDHNGNWLIHLCYHSIVVGCLLYTGQ
jgi:hypothetical protein